MNLRGPSIDTTTVPIATPSLSSYQRPEKDAVMRTHDVACEWDRIVRKIQAIIDVSMVH